MRWKKSDNKLAFLLLCKFSLRLVYSVITLVIVAIEGGKG